jgi:hypothetical protein
MKIKKDYFNFKKKHQNKKNQIICINSKCSNNNIIRNIIDTFLIKKIVLFLNQLKKEE